ncbi:hypothetical protein PTQ24_000008 [Salmonella phage KKP_3822]|uniref:Uncharacterized protein n=1 Tax=Salmonella phage KKP_3822 TaxID=3027681 RepID=A0AAX4NDC6_9CAUD
MKYLGEGIIKGINKFLLILEGKGKKKKYGKKKT